MSGQQTQTPSVEDTLKDFWASRPRRPRRGRKVAGVAAGIAHRYGMDPVIPRVAFVVATLYGGAGIVAYLLGWLFFAEEDNETSPLEALHGKGRSSASAGFTILLGLIMVPVLFWAFDHDFAGYFGLLLVVGAVFLLHRQRGHLNRPVAGVSAPDPAYQPYDPFPMYMDTTAGTTTAVPAPEPVAQTDEYGYRTSPPEWDPLGAAPFAWDLPEPARPAPPPEPQAPRPPRSRIGLVTVAVGFLAVGATVLLEPQLGGWFSVRHTIGVVLAVLGFGMVIGAFRRGGRGLIALAVPLAAAGIAMTTLWPNGLSNEGVGDINATPVTLEAVAPEYLRNIGSVQLDLTGLPATGETPVRTVAGVDIGDVGVIVPKNADVTVRCSAGLGEVDCFGHLDNGGNVEMAFTDYGPDGPGGLKIDLEARVTGAGSVEVRRG